eukprot:5908247-Alexandrium_andersonii.AAC.1
MHVHRRGGRAVAEQGFRLAANALAKERVPAGALAPPRLPGAPQAPGEYRAKPNAKGHEPSTPSREHNAAKGARLPP